MQWLADLVAKVLNPFPNCSPGLLDVVLDIFKQGGDIDALTKMLEVG